MNAPSPAAEAVDPVLKSGPGKPQFSVVIPVFNSERFIGEAIQSVVDQSCSALEIIVVDDGSLDRTAEVVRGFSTPIPILYHHQQNQGQAVARNVGVALASGNWIAFLDQDDVWYPHRLDAHADCVRQRPEVALVWSDMDYIDEVGRPRAPINWKNRLAPLMFNGSTFPSPSTVSIRKEAFLKSGGFNPHLRCNEDSEFFFRIALAHPVHLLPLKLVKYRCHETQLHRNLRRRAASWPFYHQSLSELWRDEPTKRAVLRDVSAAVYTHLGKHFLRIGEYKEARHCFRQSFAHKSLSWKNLRRWGLSYLPAVRTLYR
jgi:glycosyltransferase involved in cell wall biosynthesis